MAQSYSNARISDVTRLAGGTQNLLYRFSQGGRSVVLRRPPAVPVASSDETMRRDMGFALIDGIAALGRVDYRAVGLENFGKADNYLERQVERWRGQLASYEKYAGRPGAGGLPDVERIARFLDAHRPSTFQAGILHGDYHLANVMFETHSARLAAIIDWELSKYRQHKHRLFRNRG